MLLAMDTSTDRLCLALVESAVLLENTGPLDRQARPGEGGGLGFTGHEEAGGAAASRRLLPAAQELLARHNMSWSDLTALAVTVGPGAFSGIRAGCAAAQGLALGLEIPLIPLGSLELVALDAVAAVQDSSPGGLGVTGLGTRTVRVAIDARMDQVYEASWAWDGQRLLPMAPATVRGPQELALQWCAELPSPDSAPGHDGRHAHGHGCEIWAGSGLDLMGPEALARACEGGVELRTRSVDRPAALARLAAGAWRAGLAVDAACLVPVYVRDRVALTTAERVAAGGR